LNFNFDRQERTFASTEGAFATQTVYNTFSRRRGSSSQLTIVKPKSGISYIVPSVSPCGLGYEAVEEILDRIPEWVEWAGDKASAIPLETPGRFDVVFDAQAMAAL